MNSTPTSFGAVVLTVVCPDDDPRRFCRRLNEALGRGPWRLARAFAAARQVHPNHPDAIGTLATLMHCEFRLADEAAPIGDDDVNNLRSSLSGFEAFGLQRLESSPDAMPRLSYS